MPALWDKFWSKVDVRSPDECWPWKGLTAGKMGYGRFFTNGQPRYVNAHRMAYWIAHQDLGPGQFVCHKCDNPTCVNPAHLYAGDNSTNMRDMWRRNRR